VEENKGGGRFGASGGHDDDLSVGGRGGQALSYNICIGVIYIHTGDILRSLFLPSKNNEQRRGLK